jgi:beta-exotoxin I transport system permease protein
MRTEIARLDLVLRRRATGAYAMGLGLYVLAVVALYPEFRTSTNLNRLTAGHNAAAALFGVTGSITSPAGWLNANVYGNFLPLVLLILAVGYGSSALAGQNEDGVLALFATTPVSRRALVAQKAGALTVQLALAGIAVGAAASLGPAFDLHLAAAHLWATGLTSVLLAELFGLVALALGAAGARRGAVIGATSALGAATFLVGSLASVVAGVHPYRWLSPFYWAVANGQLARGVSTADVVVLAGLCLAALAGGLVAIGRLDLR